MILSIWACNKETDVIITPNQWNLSDEAFDELLILCDTSNLETYQEFYQRLDRMQEIFSSNDDSRGAFPTVYKAITIGAIETMEAGAYNDPVYATKFVMNFSKKYMYYLKDHLLGFPVEHHWELYYDHCANNANITRLVLEGINAHLSLDLPRSLAETGVIPDFEADWLLFGNNTVEYVPGFLEELENEYHADASEVFDLFFVGDMIDGIMGEGTAIKFGFNVLRMDAFRMALLLHVEEWNKGVEYRLRKAFYEREGGIELIDRMNLTP